MKVWQITAVDIYRDGGSYGLTFVADDGRDYELHIRTRAFEGGVSTHQPPVIYREDVNTGDVVRILTWQEARTFIAPLRHDGARFAELVEIVEREDGTRKG